MRSRDTVLYSVQVMCHWCVDLAKLGFVRLAAQTTEQTTERASDRVIN